MPIPIEHSIKASLTAWELAKQMLASEKPFIDFEVEFDASSIRRRQINQGLLLSPLTEGCNVPWVLSARQGDDLGLVFAYIEDLHRLITASTRTVFSEPDLRETVPASNPILEGSSTEFDILRSPANLIAIQQVIATPSGFGFPRGLVLTKGQCFNVLGTIQRYLTPLGNWREM